MLDGTTKRFYAYVREEADIHGIKYYLKDDLFGLIGKPNDDNLIWVCSDDDVVLQVRKIVKYMNFINVDTFFGRYTLSKGPKWETGMFFFVDNKPAMEIGKSPVNTEMFIKHMLIPQLARGIPIEGLLHMPDLTSFQRRQIRKFYETKECKRMVSEELRDILSNHGITEDTIIVRLKNLEEQAKQAKDFKTQLAIIKEFMDLTNMKDKKIIEQRIGFSETERLDSIKKEILLEETRRT